MLSHSDRRVAMPAHAETAKTGETQEQGAPVEAASADNDIVVTAQRRAQRLEDVPAAVTAISDEQLARSGVVRFMDVAQLSSGVQMQKNGYTTSRRCAGSRR